MFAAVRLPPIAPTALSLAVFAFPAQASESAAIDGANMGLWWGVPFVGLLLSIATGPLLYPHVWEHHYGKITAVLGGAGRRAAGDVFGSCRRREAVLHTLLLEYMSFIILLFALFTISGGILVAGNIHGTPLVNAGLLLIGALLASVVGTTGASMIMIRPVIRANDNRPFNAHVVVFFIFLVSNIGGSLTPLGDPPLFVGFLRGVDFFWTTRALWLRDAVRRRHWCWPSSWRSTSVPASPGRRRCRRSRTRRRTRRSACAAWPTCRCWPA